VSAAADLPAINCLVDVVLLDGEIFHSRIEDISGLLITVGAPYGIRSEDVPVVGAGLEIAWVSGDRRHAVDMRLKSITREQPPRWELQVVGSVRLQTRRNYVRGGGGEGVEIVKGGQTYTGRVMDLSEGGVRLRIREDRFERDDRVEVRLTLDDTMFPLNGKVLFVRWIPDSEGFDVIITYEPTEAVGRAIRGYVLRREMEERRRFRESVVNSG
jgi:hypothetical protein